MRVYIFKTNKKLLSLLGAAMLMATMSFAQSLAPQAVNTVGVKFTQANGSLNFTVGELVVKNQTDANGNTLGSGFTNAATGSTTVLSVNTPDKGILNVSVYPNPTTDLITVDVVSTTLSRLVVEITDLQGKTISSSQYAGISNKIGISTAAYAAGTYLLLLKNENGNLLGDYKIIKQ
jgi:hypothetical protein